MLGTIGGIPITKLGDRQERLSMLLWGKSGCGKTVLASTAPGGLLWINFDPDGTASLARRDDISVVDMANMEPRNVPNMRSGGPMETQIKQHLTQSPECETIVVDSVTSLAQLCLTYAIVSGLASGGKFTATHATPGMQAYGIRNRMVLDTINMLLRVTATASKHVIFICHEDSPKIDDQGAIQSITLLLGGSLPEEVPLKISECWHLMDTNGRRTIGIRPYGARAPMRTRMFQHSGQVTNFPFVYDQQTGKGDGINTWFQAWKATGFTKITPPVK